MVRYVVKQYTSDQAKKHGYTVKFSKSKKKKIDVWKDNMKIASLRDSWYKDYPTYSISKREAWLLQTSEEPYITSDIKGI